MSGKVYYNKWLVFCCCIWEDIAETFPEKFNDVYSTISTIGCTLKFNQSVYTPSLFKCQFRNRFRPHIGKSFGDHWCTSKVWWWHVAFSRSLLVTVLLSNFWKTVNMLSGARGQHKKLLQPGAQSYLTTT